MTAFPPLSRGRPESCPAGLFMDLRWVALLLLLLPGSLAAALVQQDTALTVAAAPTPAPFVADDPQATAGDSGASIVARFAGDLKAGAPMLTIRQQESFWTGTVELVSHQGLEGGTFLLAAGDSRAIGNSGKTRGTGEPMVEIVAGTVVQSAGTPFVTETGIEMPLQLTATGGVADWEVVVRLALVRDGVTMHQHMVFGGADAGTIVLAP